MGCGAVIFELYYRFYDAWIWVKMSTLILDYFYYRKKLLSIRYSFYYMHN